MADEFVKGLGILMTAGLGWMIVAGWYLTPSFEGTQLLGEWPENPDLYAQIALAIGDGLFWFAILGTLTFWIVIPAGRKVREELDQRSA
ncbi:DUF7314 family protein [Halapricum salinum]|uniref:DUF7314 domain-containing protein n=1 Tax=Halapricum salinum TaxID=1457250 RepID=A0A4D6H7K1_9EURY|nr:hypothetical protein [Halapricum salinum]QCC49759.1 hypothetical protein DV733_00295 [Halapricum salinum]